MSNQKRKVKVVLNNVNYCLIRAIVISIAYKEKIKERKQMLQRPTNIKLVAEVHKAAAEWNIINRCATINEIAELE